MRILLIEDTSSQHKTLHESLTNKYQLDIAENMKDGKYYIGIRNYDLVLSAWVLSDGSGNDIITSVREKHGQVPVIIFSNSVQHELEALNCGADDYVNTPINIEILLARIETRLKLIKSNIIEIEDLVIIPDEERIMFKGKEVEVKGKPFEVLTHLARHKDQIVSKEQLLNAIWEEPELVTPNVIEVAINQIRQKMDKILGIDTIETVRRRGYRFCYPKK
ncbi:homeostatic response regulator transcription factor HsrA [Helicobacter sp. 11S02629-2]|uniref:homeostatic response regulator transcription factor HsrA n=1 Tax=Helicobacter sp. 11S02629-2 TaxID=1476195 RepID=UPI000BA74036|nr:homeostatic response regulator transcription factor HsrA [Helicobacter sp. 11S02629-2]PAF45493.1 DNA-binding response regulator [Helicobacter sp. 11S02629-2]